MLAGDIPQKLLPRQEAAVNAVLVSILPLVICSQKVVAHSRTSKYTASNSLLHVQIVSPHALLAAELSVNHPVRTRLRLRKTVVDI